MLEGILILGILLLVISNGYFIYSNRVKDIQIVTLELDNEYKQMIIDGYKTVQRVYKDGKIFPREGDQTAGEKPKRSGWF
jgi:hypothetical protein